MIYPEAWGFVPLGLKKKIQAYIVKSECMVLSLFSFPANWHQTISLGLSSIRVP